MTPTYQALGQTKRTPSSGCCAGTGILAAFLAVVAILTLLLYHPPVPPPTDSPAPGPGRLTTNETEPRHQVQIRRRRQTQANVITNKKDPCHARWGGVTLPYAPGQRTAYTFDLCQVIDCSLPEGLLSQDATGWHHYPLYLCGFLSGVPSGRRGGWCNSWSQVTAPDGSITKALEGLRALSNQMAEDSGVENPLEGWMTGMFGKWKNLIMSLLMSLAVFVGVLVCCGCCCIPCTRALLERLINKALTKEAAGDTAVMAPLLDMGDPEGDQGENQGLPMGPGMWPTAPLAPW